MKKTSYVPLTAAPWRQSETYREVLPKSPQLAGVIRCFWGSGRPYRRAWQEAAVTLVIPDTCVDIVYEIDHTANTVTGRFCGVNDASFKARDSGEPGHVLSVFGIRFYAWAAAVFSEDSMKGTVNGCFDVRSRFCRLDRLLGQQLFETDSLEERSILAEKLLLGQVPPARRHRAVDQAVEQILSQKGVLTTDRLARECFISSRQLERLFHEYIGITPKKLCGLVRYQCLWSEVIRTPGFRILDGVSQYGYADQSHLMREFKRYHTMDIQQAVLYGASRR
ncbi:MAG: helix-turn-helix transcriptional regulator [Hungatella sp.]|nr:helix-turn-helix transcriptional regulator [Hungatella sp.]